MSNIVIVEPGTKIWAHVVQPGMILRGADGWNVEVERITEEHDSFIFDNGAGRVWKVGYAARVEVLGYFNPENRNAYVITY